MKKFIFFLLSLSMLQGFAHDPAGIIQLQPATDTLYPPTSLQTQNVENQVHLTWNKPAIPGGGTPAGLLGYYIYRNGNKVQYVNDPDMLYCFDYDLEPAWFIYKATAYYDLTPYGYPGQFAESCFSNSDTIYAGYAYILPLWEPWDQASFIYNDWIFNPSIGNWDISTTEGNPSPTAIFTGNPELNNFEFGLVSCLLSHYSSCFTFFVEFDLNMQAISPDNTAHLFFDVYYDSTWYNKATYDNINTGGWIHCTHDISEMTGSCFRIRFRAAGISSSVINNWMVDNILVSFFCNPPDTVEYGINNNIVTLYWEEPCRQTDTTMVITGYNVFRTDSTGLPPYTRLNEEFITDTFYVDSTTKSGGEFRYRVNIVYPYCYSDTSLPVLVTIPVGTEEAEDPSIRIFPNPVTGLLQIRSGSIIETVTLWSVSGIVQFQCRNIHDRKISIPTDHLSEGMYWVGISTRSGYLVKKVVISHR